MSSEDSKQSDGLGGLFDRLGFAATLMNKVRFGGPIGKLALLGVLGFLVLIVIAFRIDPAQLLMLTVLMLAFISLVGGGIFVFAMKHPELATLEGAEVISLRQQGEFGTDVRAISAVTLEAMEATANPIDVEQVIGPATESGRERIEAPIRERAVQPDKKEVE